MIEQLIGEIAKQGLMGVFLAILIYAYYRKDNVLAKERDERLSDLKEIKDQYTNLVTGINSTLDKLCSLIKQGRG